MRSGSVIAIGCAVGLMACKKEKHETLLLEPPFMFCEDTTIVSVPNVFTLDGDGINEEFFVSSRMISDFHLEVTSTDGRVMLDTEKEHDAWDGTDPERTGNHARYYYHLRCVTTAGTVLDVTKAVYVVTDHYKPCFDCDVMPVFGDQFDPRLCGISYATNDLVCVQ